MRLLAVALLLVASSAMADRTSDLMGLGMPPQLADKLGNNIFDSNIDYQIDNFLIAANTTDGADDKRIYISGGSSTSQDTGAVMILHGNEHAIQPGHAVIRCGNVANAVVSIKSAGNQNVQLGTQDTARIVLNGSGSLVHFTNDMDFTQNSSDGSDNRRTRISAGGDVTSDRSAHAWIFGNEYASTGGDFYVRSGNVSGGDVVLDVTNNGGDLRIQSNGTDKLKFTGGERIIDFTGTMGSSTKSPETAPEDGWIEIKINGVSKYIPYYNAS